MSTVYMPNMSPYCRLWTHTVYTSLTSTTCSKPWSFRMSIDSATIAEVDVYGQCVRGTASCCYMRRGVKLRLDGASSNCGGLAVQLNCCTTNPQQIEQAEFELKYYIQATDSTLSYDFARMLTNAQYETKVTHYRISETNAYPMVLRNSTCWLTHPWWQKIFNLDLVVWLTKYLAVYGNSLHYYLPASWSEYKGDAMKIKTTCCTKLIHNQGCHRSRLTKFPDFSLTSRHYFWTYSLTFSDAKYNYNEHYCIWLRQKSQ
jgi:hypothetical protein